MQMLRTFSREAFEFGLASWRWLGISGKTPRFTTLFGDVFLESLEGWWFLDTVEGTLELRWTTAVDMYAELETPEGRATYLLEDLVQEATRRDLRLAPDEVYAFQPHPATGGEMSIEYVTMVRFALAVSWSGQVHEQLRWHNAGPATTAADVGWAVPPDPLAAAWDSAWQGAESVAAAPRGHTVGRHAHPDRPAAVPAAAPTAAPVAAPTAVPAEARPFATGTYPAVPTATHATVPTPPYPATGTYPAAYATGTHPAVPTATHATVPAPPVGEPFGTAAPAPATPSWDDLWRRRR